MNNQKIKRLIETTYVVTIWDENILKEHICLDKEQACNIYIREKSKLVSCYGSPISTDVDCDGNETIASFENSSYLNIVESTHAGIEQNHHLYNFTNVDYQVIYE